MYVYRAFTSEGQTKELKILNSGQAVLDIDLEFENFDAIKCVNDQFISKVISTANSTNNSLQFILSNSKNKDPKYSKFLISTNYKLNIQEMYKSIGNVIWGIFENMISNVI